MKLIETEDKRVVNWDNVDSIEFEHDDYHNIVHCIVCVEKNIKIKLFKIRVFDSDTGNIINFMSQIHKWISLKKDDFISHKDLLRKSEEILNEHTTKPQARNDESNYGNWKIGERSP